MPVCFYASLCSTGKFSAQTKKMSAAWRDLPPRSGTICYSKLNVKSENYTEHGFLTAVVYELNRRRSSSMVSVLRIYVQVKTRMIGSGRA